MWYDSASEHHDVVAGSARVSVGNRAADDRLAELAEHCIAARQIIDRCGTSVMRSLIDVLLFEIATAMAAESEARRPSERDDQD